MRPPQGAEWLVILVLVLLLFGAKRLPDMARGLGRSMRILKAETKGLHDDDTLDPALPPATTTPAALPDAAAARPGTTEIDVSEAPVNRPSPPSTQQS